MRIQCQILGFLSLISIVCFARAKKLCDVRVWYLNMITENVFDVDLTEEQLNLKDSIENMVLKASESRDTRMVDCSVLYMYNEMLKDLFNYTPSGSGMSLKEVETEEVSQSNGNVQNDRNLRTTSDTAEKTDGQEAQTTDEVSTHDEDFAAIDTNTKTNEKIGAIDKNTDTVEETPEKYDNGVSSDFQNAMVDIEESVSTDGEDKTGIFQTDELNSVSKEETIGSTDHTADNIDETELLEDDNTDLSHSFSEDIMQTNQNHIEETHDNDEDLFVTSSIPFGVCWSFGCLMSDVFDVYSRGEQIDFSNEFKKRKVVPETCNKTLLKQKRKLKVKYPVGPVCTLKCFYKFLLSNSFCMKGVLNSSSLLAEQTTTEKVDEITDHRREDIQYEKDNTDKNSGLESMQNTIVETNSESDTKYKDNYETNSKSTIKNMQPSDGGTDTFTYSGKHKTAEVEESLNSFSSFTANNAQNELKLTEFENIVEQKTSKYYSKIQTIEVMIMRLENQLLTEALNKQNHSSTITKLENQILKLENELLKMNKNYQHLREESENMSKRQNKYLELAYKEAKKEYPKLPDRSNEKYELITQHQTKINELAEVLRNQTSIIMQLKGKYDNLEEQNKILHQMVMNQTIFMSSIVKTVQDLTEQNIKSQKEINTLKLKVEQNTLAVAENEKEGNEVGVKDVIDELDSLLFNNMVLKSRSIQKIEGFETKETGGSQDHSHLKDYVEKKYDNVITKWCPRDNRTCPSCQYSPVVYSSCIPFRNIVWLTYERQNSDEQNQAESDYPSVPDVKDEKKENEKYNAANSAQSNLQERELPVPSNTKQEGADGNFRATTKDSSDMPEQNTENNKVDLNEEKLMTEDEGNVLSKYTIVGYDSNGKPVLRIRESIEEKKTSAEIVTAKDTNNLKTESETNISGVKSQVTNNAHLPKNDNTLKTEQHIDNGKDINYVSGDKEKEGKTSEHVKMQVPTLKGQQDIKRKDSDIDKEMHISVEARNIISHEDQTFQARDLKSGTNDNIQKAANDGVNSIDKEITHKDSVTHTTPVSDENKDIPTRKESLVDQQTISISKHVVPDSKKEEKLTSLEDRDNTRSVDQTVNRKSINDRDNSIEKNISSIDVVTHGTPVLNENKNSPTTKENVDNQEDNLKNNNDAPEKIKEESKTALKEDKGSAINQKTLTSNEGQTKTVKATNANTENKEQTKIPKKTNIENKPKQKKIPVNLNKYKQNEAKDCYDYYSKGERKDGLFKVKPLGTDRLIEVFCDMRRGGWTVIQRRQDGSTNFFKEWDNYKKGFGGLYGEHWLGNDNIHLLTNQDYYKLRVDLMDWDKTKKYAEFEYFLVDNEDEGYKLHIDKYTGDAGDGLTKHDGSKFSTKDVDNDKVVKEFSGSCAKRFYGAGWYYKCYSSNLNGKFYKGGKIPEKRFDGVTWKPWTGPNHSLKKVEMKVRPASAKN